MATKQDTTGENADENKFKNETVKARTKQKKSTTNKTKQKK